jgi:hypothetical protein
MSQSTHRFTWRKIIFLLAIIISISGQNKKELTIYIVCACLVYFAEDGSSVDNNENENNNTAFLQRNLSVLNAVRKRI